MKADSSGESHGNVKDIDSGASPDDNPSKSFSGQDPEGVSDSKLNEHVTEDNSSEDNFSGDSSDGTSSITIDAWTEEALCFFKDWLVRVKISTQRSYH